MVAVTVAVAFWNSRTSASEDRTRTVAHATVVKRSYTIIDIVTNAIGVGVGGAVTTTLSKGIQLVAFAIAIAF